MKKTIGLLLAVALVIGVFAATALASTGDGIRDYDGAQAGNGYAWGVDVDGDSINGNFVDSDGDGLCDNFVDSDGDGINDLRGMTAGRGLGSGSCDGAAFIDENGDGLCDNAGPGVGGQQMGGNGRGGRNR